ncbi:MAG TPA: FtsX-like permease family protein [Bacteroidia bacterium]
MRISAYIAKRLALGKFKSFASLIIRLAWIGAGLSVAVMIIAVAIVVGYKEQITEKVLGFGGHIEIHSTGTSGNFDYVQFNDSAKIIEMVKSTPNVKNIAPVFSRPGIMKSGDEFEGVVFKGVNQFYDSNFLKQNLLRGRYPGVGDSLRKREILISKVIADKLKIDTGDVVRVYFINEPVRVIPCRITGVYETGLEETDNVFVIGSLMEMQRIFSKQKNEITHYEVNTKDVNLLLETDKQLSKKLPHELNAENLMELNESIFSWLGYLDQNISIILTLMIIVACINMITALLILILERTNMIGILKAMGSNNRLIKRIFLNHALYILILGLIFGNVLGLGLCYIQSEFKIITLQQEIYYLSYVPVSIKWLHILAINVGTVILCMAALLLPVRLINKIDPVKAIKFK